MKRRFFLLAAPAIVAAPSLMRVSMMPRRLRTESLADIVTRLNVIQENMIAGGLLVVENEGEWVTDPLFLS